jgi:hypothetical protein
VERNVLCVWCKRTKLERSNGEREYVRGKERITSMSQAHLFVTYVEKNCYDSAFYAGAELTNPRLTTWCRLEAGCFVDSHREVATSGGMSD